MIYKKGWIEACLAVQRTTNAPLVTPFNTETNFHYTLKSVVVNKMDYYYMV